MGGKIPGEGVIWKDFIRRASREPNIYPQRVIKKLTKKQLRKLVLAQSRRRTQRFWTIRWCDYVINQKKVKDLGDITIPKMSQLDNADEEGEIDF